MPSTSFDRIDRDRSERPVSALSKQASYTSAYSTPSKKDYRGFAATEPNEYLLRDRANSAIYPPNHQPTTKFVRWGVAWQAPTFMVACAAAGLALAIGHHFYYQSLHGTVAGSSMRQQWAIKFGTAFSVVVLVLFKTACDTAYNQYVWTLFRRRAYSLDALDKLFALTSSLIGFTSWEVILRAKLAVFLALTSWHVCQPLTCRSKRRD